MFICIYIFYMFIYLITCRSSFSFGICFVWIYFSFRVHLCFWGSSHLSFKFPCLFAVPIFVQSSRSVMVSYFIFIPVFVILLFSVALFNLRLGRI